MLVLNDPDDLEKARRERETPCPRCAQAGRSQPTLKTPHVTFFRCVACGHMWVARVRQG